IISQWFKFISHNNKCATRHAIPFMLSPLNHGFSLQVIGFWFRMDRARYLTGARILPEMLNSAFSAG
ncbi:MAG: hypothetical protein KFF68_15460, partial [Desulfosarcina sp.]|nr:hypothetical protein [Desulfosarcina sp.]